MPAIANSIPAAVAVLRGVAPDAGAMNALPKKPTLAQLAKFLATTREWPAREEFLASDAVSDAFKEKVRKRMSLHDIARCMSFSDMMRQLSAIVKGMDDFERQLLAIEALRELPGPNDKPDDVAGIPVAAYDPLDEDAFAAVLGMLHGRMFVRDLVDDVRAHASLALLDTGRAWDLAWAIYVHAARRHLPFLSARPVCAESAVLLGELGGASEFVVPDESERASDEVAAQLAGLALA